MKLNKSLEKILPEMYEDALRPGMKKIGTALERIADVVNTALIPIEIINKRSQYWKENYLERWRKKMEYIPDHNVKPIDREIGIPIIEKMTYTTSEELSEMFLDLLTSAADNRKENFIHPSFAQITSQLSVDEARILRYMRKENQPLCSVHIRINYGSSYSDHFHGTTIFDCNDALKFKNNMNAYVENLLRLSLIKKWGTPLDVDQFSKIENYLEPSKQALESQYPDFKKIEYIRRYYNFSMYGKNFIECCIP